MIFLVVFTRENFLDFPHFQNSFPNPREILFAIFFKHFSINVLIKISPNFVKSLCGVFPSVLLDILPWGSMLTLPLFILPFYYKLPPK